MDVVKVGQITTAVGIKGEIRVYPYTDSVTRFSDMKKLMLGNQTELRDIEKLRYDKNMVILKLSGISDRNMAESLRGQNVFVPKSDWNQPEDVYFIEDLVGCKVFSDADEYLGELVSVIQKPGQDIYEIKSESGKVFLLPAVKDFILSVDTDSKRIVAHIIEGLLDL